MKKNHLFPPRFSGDKKNNSPTVLDTNGEMELLLTARLWLLMNNSKTENKNSPLTLPEIKKPIGTDKYSKKTSLEMKLPELFLTL